MKLRKEMMCLACSEQVDLTLETFIHKYYLCSKCISDTKFMNRKYLFVYSGTIKKLIHNLKFSGDTRVVKVIALLLRRHIGRGVIIFPPSSRRKTLERGFVPIEEILKCMPNKWINPFEKIGNYSNHELAKSKRKSKIKLTKHIPKKVILIDDVYTTGKTIRACERLLKERGVKYKIILFSKATFFD